MIRGRLTLISIFLLISLLLVGTHYVKSTQPFTQETIIVDINGNGDYTSIRDAIANATATDTILIKEGTYYENDITIEKKVTIIGETESKTVIDCNGQNGLILKSKYVEIRNLKITNGNEFLIDMLVESGGNIISECTIEKLTAGIGIRIQSNSNTISSCEFIGRQPAIGLQLRREQNIIKNCTFKGFDVGILALLNTVNNKIQSCNIFNNNIGIDIRINSLFNTVTDCNIYSNVEGVKIWQGSTNNTVYSNNFFKNDKDAYDENTNSWDYGTIGNYWDDYRGADNNGDGIGDTPYEIGNGNRDRYPYLTLILPDIITEPSNIKQVTGRFDPTPTFLWTESLYRKGINGYYIKIDSDKETFIGDTTTWTSPISISDGVHTFYVRAESIDGKTSGYETLTFSIDTTFKDLDGDGWSDAEEITYGTNPDDPNNYPLDADNDHIPDSIDSDDDNDGYSDAMELSYITSSIDPNSHPVDTDYDGIPDDSSPDEKYVGDTDDDNDGLNDNLEEQLGSDSKYSADVLKIYIKGEQYYLVDISKTGIYDILYNPRNEVTTNVERDGDYYLIDGNGDENWDHRYNILDGSVNRYEETTIFSTAIWIIPIIAIFVIIIFYFVKIKPLHLRFKKPKLKLIRLDKDTKSMVIQTRTLLERIQNDVKIYMDQLQQIEGKIEPTEAKIEEEFVTAKIPEERKVIPKEIKTRVTSIEDIEKEVDDLLLQYKNHKNN